MLPHLFHRPFRAVLIILFALLCSNLAWALTPVRRPAPTPVLISEIRQTVLRTIGSETPIQLESLAVKVAVAGTQATTTLDMVFYNPNSRQLEGELQFPLLPQQQISGFALDINGTMRPAVPVEKAKGRQVFDEIERRRVDPGLLEKTVGNQFKLRVYPVPAYGRRTVQITVNEALATRNGQLLYRLPLDFFKSVAAFKLQVDVAGSSVAPQLQGSLLPLKFVRDGDGYSARFDKASFAPQGQLQLSWPATARPQVYTQAFDSERFFVAEVPLKAASKPRVLPKTIGLLWDSSGSGANRALPAELALLDRYFKAMGNGEVRLVRLRDRAEAVQSYKIAGGDWSALRQALQGTQYDGATALGGWQPQADVGEYLLFSDGVGNYGSDDVPDLAPGQRLYSINSASAADSVRLAALAARNRGRLITLDDQAGVAQAARQLLEEAPHIAGLAADSASQLVAQSPYADDGMLRIAGVLGAAEDTLRITLEQGGQRSEIRLPLRTGSNPHPAAAAQWAQYRIATLEAEPQRYRGEIRRLGQRFGLPTRETSLIVLETIADYVRYEIEPPASERAAYLKLKAEQGTMQAQTRRKHVEDVVREFEQKVAWWQRDYPKGAIPTPKPAPAAKSGRFEESASLDFQKSEANMEGRVFPATPMAAAPAMARKARAEVVADMADKADAAAPAISIALKRWTPDAPYISRLRNAKPAALYAIYLDEKPGYANSSAFYLDVADLLFEQNQRDLALRVLSNLAEMDLENRHILRILAYRLLQTKAPELAVPIFEQVRDMAEEEPQSFRDLGLAYAAVGREQDAVEQLNEVIVRPWDGRFAEIELIAVAELNAIVANARTMLDTRSVDPRLLKNLPLDLRVILTWDADNSDMDLWVTDPNGERCYYGHRFTYQGGRMSRDFTGGYGPEEFSLRHAKPGKYKVEVNFYGNRQQTVAGATTLQVKLATGFGGKNAREQIVTLRLKDRSETVFVGEFEVLGNGNAKPVKK
ncbi:hypothetical protein IGB42_00419 [Andreprevotia sp. IGB-42]|uniref:VIT domain-containing protein n=1 Tax=Andreprevotia sp. IGB-42 TaxID=2497473 RepID=UPI001356EEDC|nr:VIT domain-containing protein [Andreprevotia sp. IGB-42]KAF0815338.1 hypothetical protein IGB42_00419 [Andreprevotia sp. IGB-42]